MDPEPAFVFEDWSFGEDLGCNAWGAIEKNKTTHKKQNTMTFLIEEGLNSCFGGTRLPFKGDVAVRRLLRDVSVTSEAVAAVAETIRSF